MSHVAKIDLRRLGCYNSTGLPSSLVTATIGFPKPGSFCKTGFSVLGKAKTGFGFGSHIIAFTVNLRGRGRSKRRRRPHSVLSW